MNDNAGGSTTIRVEVRHGRLVVVLDNPETAALFPDYAAGRVWAWDEGLRYFDPIGTVPMSTRTLRAIADAIDSLDHVPDFPGNTEREVQP